MGVNFLWYHDDPAFHYYLMAHFTPCVRVDTVQARSPRIHGEDDVTYLLG
jgi:hypothetical protein